MCGQLVVAFFLDRLAGFRLFVGGGFEVREVVVAVVLEAGGEDEEGYGEEGADAWGGGEEVGVGEGVGFYGGCCEVVVSCAPCVDEKKVGMETYEHPRSIPRRS